MSEQSQSTIGTVAQEAARLIEDMASMARSSYSRGADPSTYAGGTAWGPGWPYAPSAAGPAEEEEAGASASTGESSEGACTLCGAERDAIPPEDSPSSCQLCPLCRGITMLRSVRPETIELLADLAMSVAAGLRDVAVWSRASDPASSARSTSAAPPDAERSPVQDIPVDDESEE